jgi:hypothetical protein
MTGSSLFLLLAPNNINLTTRARKRERKKERKNENRRKKKQTKHSPQHNLFSVAK